MTVVASNKSRTVHQVPAACADEAKAVEFLEAMRWGDTPACPRCGDTAVYQMKGKNGQRNARFLWRCRGCKKQFTVRIGTVMEDSPIPLRHWVFAFWAASASKKGVSALQIQRMTGLDYKSALFMMHRIRWAMRNGDSDPLTGDVEVDETYVGGKPRKESYQSRRERYRAGRSKKGKRPDFKQRKTEVIAMIERGGRARVYVPTDVTGENIHDVIRREIDDDARLHTDESRRYLTLGKEFSAHHVVTHGKEEYARMDGDVLATTNTVEAFFAILKRGVIGTFHNVSRKHLHRYVSEFAFRWTTRYMDDGARLKAIIRNSEGRRLTYAEQIG